MNKTAQPTTQTTSIGTPNRPPCPPRCPRRAPPDAHDLVVLEKVIVPDVGGEDDAGVPQLVAVKPVVESPWQKPLRVPGRGMDSVSVVCVTVCMRNTGVPP